MKLLRINDIDVDEVIKRSEENVNEVIPAVADILSEVHKNKDEALIRFTEKFDNVELDDLKVTPEEIKEAYENVDDKLLKALKLALTNIKKFHEREIPEEWEMEVTSGVKAGQIVRPINSVGQLILQQF